MSTSAIVTDVDWTMRRAAKIPGPGAYDLSYGSMRSGGRFSTAKPKTEVEWLMHRAKQLPGPGEYERKLAAPSGGRFGSSSPKTNLEEIMARAAKVPGPGLYDNDIYSIGRRTGAVSQYPQSATSSKLSSPQPQHSGIPPEARRRPTPSKQPGKDDPGDTPPGPRPHTVLGLVSDGERSERNRNLRQLPELKNAKDKKTKSVSLPWYKKGISREGSLRGHSPAKWMIPESAQRAYGVWLDDDARQKKTKSRRKMGASADKSKTLSIKVHMGAGNVGQLGTYESEIFDADSPVECISLFSIFQDRHS